MRMGAAQDSGVEHIRELDVVDKGPLAGQQLRVFKPFQRLACVWHARPPCCGETGVQHLRRGAMAEYMLGWRENLPVTAKVRGLWQRYQWLCHLALLETATSPSIAPTVCTRSFSFPAQYR